MARLAAFALPETVCPPLRCSGMPSHDAPGLPGAWLLWQRAGRCPRSLARFGQGVTGAPLAPPIPHPGGGKPAPTLGTGHIRPFEFHCWLPWVCHRRRLRPRAWSPLPQCSHTSPSTASLLAASLLWAASWIICAGIRLICSSTAVAIWASVAFGFVSRYCATAAKTSSPCSFQLSCNSFSFILLSSLTLPLFYHPFSSNQGAQKMQHTRPMYLMLCFAW